MRYFFINSHELQCFQLKTYFFMSFLNNIIHIELLFHSFYFIIGIFWKCFKFYGLKLVCPFKIQKQCFCLNFFQTDTNRARFQRAVSRFSANPVAKWALKCDVLHHARGSRWTPTQKGNSICLTLNSWFQLLTFPSSTARVQWSPSVRRSSCPVPA